MDSEQERQLREWARVLGGANEPDRRAMGRAIMMLLDQIEALRAELARRPPASEAEVVQDAGPAVELPADTMPLGDTIATGFRDRLRAAAHRGER